MRFFITIAFTFVLLAFPVYAADTTPPTTPTSLARISLPDDTTPSFLWGASTDASGINHYAFKIGNGDTYTNVGINTTYTITTPLSAGNHTAYVRAVDNAGNTSLSESLTFSITAPADTTPPETTITSQPAASTTSTSATFEFSANETSTFACALDSQFWPARPVEFSTCISPRTYSGLTAIGHVLQVRATDTAGNTDPTPAIASWSIIADIIVPTIPTNLIRTTANTDLTPIFTWGASTDNVGVISYEVRFDSNAFVDIGNVLSYTESTPLTAGEHPFSIRAKDAAGNLSLIRIAAATTYIVITAPTTPVTPPAPATLVTPSDPVTPAVTSTPSTPATISISSPPFTLAQMATDSAIISQGSSSTLLSSLSFSSVLLCQMSEADAMARVDRVFLSVTDATIRAAIINFTACGTISTLHLGAGERLGVVNSYKSAFERLPSTTAHWNDIIKIANGRFPGETSARAEADAKASFSRVYLRAPNMDQQNDKAAVTVMAYGLRPLPRNMNSESAAISIYKKIFGETPLSATEWDTLRAIAYSGAVR